MNRQGFGVGHVLLILGVVLLLGAGVYVASAYADVNVGNGQTTYKVVCTGTVDVTVAGIGAPSLNPAPQCRIQECGWLTLSVREASFLDSFKDIGNVQLVVDGKILSGQPFESYGTDVDYTLTSSCVASPQSARVELYEGSKLVDQETVRLQ